MTGSPNLMLAKVSHYTLYGTHQRIWPYDISWPLSLISSPLLYPWVLAGGISTSVLSSASPSQGDPPTMPCHKYNIGKRSTITSDEQYPWKKPLCITYLALHRFLLLNPSTSRVHTHNNTVWYCLRIQKYWQHASSCHVERLKHVEVGVVSLYTPPSYASLLSLVPRPIPNFFFNPISWYCVITSITRPKMLHKHQNIHKSMLIESSFLVLCLSSLLPSLLL